MLGHPPYQYSPPRVGFPILRVPPSQLAFTHPPTHHPSPISFPPLQHQQSVTAPHRQCGRTREGRWMKGWMGKSDKAGSAQRGPGTITCPGSTCPLPAGPAHLDPAGLCSHLVYPPPALHANPLSRGAPHVGASGGHVSAPPSPGARVARPLPDTRQRRGRCGAGSPAPSLDAGSRGEPGKGTRTCGRLKAREPGPPRHAAGRGLQRPAACGWRAGSGSCTPARKGPAALEGPARIVLQALAPWPVGGSGRPRRCARLSPGLAAARGCPGSSLGGWS